jgi:2-polyprenyl-6-methoxyphenol hydroxylase-like FAD-dependent oxidoreductase
MKDTLRVIVIGAGLGGLCLAQALRKAGVAVEVYERDREPGSRWEGYRIHLDPAGARSLRACLPHPLWEAFLATSGHGGDLGFVTEQLDELVIVEESITYPYGGSDPTENHYAVDRATLRRLLLARLDDAVHFGAEFVRYEHTGDGRVAAIFADGHRAVGDVLVGADGTSSRVRRQYLPHAEPVAAGVGGVAHKLFLDDSTRAWIPRRLQDGMNLVIADGPVSLFTSVYEPPPGARSALQAATGVAAAGIDAPYILCALNVDPAVLPHDLTALDDDAVRRTVDRLVAGWHPDLRRLLAESDPASRNALSFTVSPQIAPWQSTNVTVLGDAIHTMPPTGGLGGNTALRDARLLGQMLTAVARGDRDLAAAVGEYETEMRDYGYAAVRGALSVRDQMLATGAAGTFAARTWFRICRAVPSLRRRTFRHDWRDIAAPRSWERSAPEA